MSLPDIARDATYHRAPEGLRGKVLGSLAQAPLERHAAARRWSWLAIAATAATIGWIGGAWHAREGAPDPASREVLDAHVRSLMPGAHLNDVASSDQHTVKPWFAGRLDFSPPVRDAAAQGFPLMGGRVDYLGGRPVAALTYQRRLHVINLFAWPAPEASAEERPKASSLRGYSMVRWTQAGMRHWAISDVNAAELDAFAEALAASR
jgi:anti-sigma factor RsiW